MMCLLLAAKKEILVDRLKGVDGAVIAAIFNPLPPSDVRQLHEQLYLQSSSRFVKFDGAAVELSNNDLSPLVYSYGVPTKVMDALLVSLSLRDQRLVSKDIYTYLLLFNLTFAIKFRQMPTMDATIKTWTGTSGARMWRGHATSLFP